MEAAWQGGIRKKKDIFSLLVLYCSAAFLHSLGCNVKDGRRRGTLEKAGGEVNSE